MYKLKKFLEKSNLSKNTAYNQPFEQYSYDEEILTI